MPVTTAEAQSRMRAKLEELASAGASRVLLYGAGRHTAKVGEVLANTPVEIVGIIDDDRGGQGQRLWNWPILSREEAVASGADAVVISSDSVEQYIYEAYAGALTSRDIAVHRLYGATEDETSTFIDISGGAFARIPGYRERVKPGWQEMIQGDPGRLPAPTSRQATVALQLSLKRVALLEKYLQVAGFGIQGKDVLEIGCWDGACTFALALSGCRRVVGIDHQDYFLWNVEPAEITDSLRATARESLATLQGATRQAAVDHGLTDGPGGGPSRVELLIDDINNCSLPEASFDVICSWQTLEHLIPPEAAFATMARLLRPGGVCFHEYGAFTSLRGGHALCTLDFPWGHVRLGDADVDRYLRQYRPTEHGHAIRHYRRFLNRLMLADIPRLAKAARLTLLERAVWLDRQQFEDELQPEYLDEARRHYPDITLEDMIHNEVWLLLQKPE